MKLLKQKVQYLKEISIAIDNWNDIFSDFDPRPLGEKSLSEDFINELKKRYQETKSGNLLLTIYAPIELKANAKTEKKVIRRIKMFFDNRYKQSNKRIRQGQMKGLLFIFFGIVLLGFLTFSSLHGFYSKIVLETMGIVLLPLGWFGVWEGFSKIIDTSPIFIREENLFKKLSTASYKFKYIED